MSITKILSRGISTLPAGSVLQVVNATASTSVTTTSTSFVVSGLSVSITPTSASNKVLLFVTGIGAISGVNTNPIFTLFENSSNLANNDGMIAFYNNAGSLRLGVSIHFLASPNTTSATTYSLRFRNNAGGETATFMVSNTIASITAMEISA